MTTAAEFDEADISLVSSIVERYRTRELNVAERLSENLVGLLNDKKLAPLIHSIKSRAKDPAHLEDKLFRKLRKSKIAGENPFDITPENLFEKITDLAGIRILHLHTAQFLEINKILTELFDEEGYVLVEGPEARTWDDEYRELFKSNGIATVESARMYTSVHYVVQANARTKRTAEIQVRTLAEELWGEVDHEINYPHPSDIVSCKEQIKVLARLTSSCTRLVDSIFFSKKDASKQVERG